MSAGDSEWFGEPHTLTVHEVRLPDGPLDDGEFGDYDLEHPPSCEQEEIYDGHVLHYTCALAYQEEQEGLATSLRYSATPITEPGTYRIQAWGRKTYYPGVGYEHDAGIGVMDPESGDAAWA